MESVLDSCPECRARIASDQRYCLDCGRRIGPLRVDWKSLVAPRALTPPAPLPTAATAAVALPSPRVAATLLLIVMGFGVIVAGAATSDVPRALASSPRAPLTIVLPPKAAPAPALPTEDAPPAAAPEPAAPLPAPALPVAGFTPVPLAPVDDDEKDEELIDEPAPSDVPSIKHVFLISLGPGAFEQWFGETSAVPYLADELAPQGTLLSGYRAVAAGELANEIALISGRPANPQTDANCPVYSSFDGEEGCVHPLDAYTLPDQLIAQGHTWKAYIEGQDAPGADPASCRHPEEGQPDPFAAPGRPGDPYVTWRNPFVYFQTITTSPDCAANDVGLTSLDADLAEKQATASFSWIAPAPENASPAGAEAWLRTVVPKILASEAYADDGLIAIVPDASGAPENFGTGALLLSEDHVRAGAVDTTPYDHLSTLKSIEELFSLRYLGGAAKPKVKSFVSPLLH